MTDANSYGSTGNANSDALPESVDALQNGKADDASDVEVDPSPAKAAAKAPHIREHSQQHNSDVAQTHNSVEAALAALGMAPGSELTPTDVSYACKLKVEAISPLSHDRGERLKVLQSAKAVLMRHLGVHPLWKPAQVHPAVPEVVSACPRTLASSQPLAADDQTVPECQPTLRNGTSPETKHAEDVPETSSAGNPAVRENPSDASAATGTTPPSKGDDDADREVERKLKLARIVERGRRRAEKIELQIKTAKTNSDEQEEVLGRPLYVDMLEAVETYDTQDGFDETGYREWLGEMGVADPKWTNIYQGTARLFETPDSSRQLFNKRDKTLWGLRASGVRSDNVIAALETKEKVGRKERYGQARFIALYDADRKAQRQKSAQALECRSDEEVVQLQSPDLSDDAGTGATWMGQHVAKKKVRLVVDGKEVIAGRIEQHGDELILFDT